MGKDDGAGGGSYKLLGTLSAVAGAFVARKLLRIVWKALTGKTPPDKPESLDVGLAEALTWAVASGAAVGIARVVAQRQVASTWQKANGELPADAHAPAK